MRRLTVELCLKFFKWKYRALENEFLQSIQDPVSSQTLALRKILKSCEGTDYGRFFGLHGKMSVADYQSKVPIVQYSELSPWIERQKQNPGKAILTDRLKFFEKTSGSTHSAKDIPYNSSHLQSFNRMFILWSLNLLSSGLKLKSGRVFFLITPQSGSALRDDSEYLQGFVSWLADFFFIDTSSAAQCYEIQEYIPKLATLLCQERQLEVISVWSPSLLVLLTDEILRQNPKITSLNQVWPELQLISCWDSAGAWSDAQLLRERFPGVRIQGKGLLATEAPITIPWDDVSGGLPLLNEIFLEFEESLSGQILQLHEIHEGQIYNLIVSCKNGFLRYKLGDLVTTTGQFGKTPNLIFLGRNSQEIDLAGEKMSLEWSESVLSQNKNLGYHLLVPQQNFENRGYILLTDSAQFRFQEIEFLEATLCQQHHYAQARKLGQLRPLRAIYRPNLRLEYYQACQKLNRQLGQVKPQSLITHPKLAAKLLNLPGSWTEV